MATFRELWSAIAPAGSPIGWVEPTRLDRDVAWVRVLKARVPAFDAFDPGDVAIVPGSALVAVAPAEPETGILVDALLSGRCAGVLLIPAGDGGAADAALAALGEAVVAAGIPAIDVGSVDTQALERSAIGFLVNQRAELEHQATLIEASLEEIALAGADLGALVAGVGGLLGRAVVLEGRRGEVLQIHAPEHAPGAAAAVATYVAGGRRAALRVALPAPLEPAESPPRPGRRDGRLLLLGERPATALERVVAPRIARLLALELGRAEAVRRAHETSRRGEVLPSDGPPWVILVARQVPGGDGPTIDAREEARARVRALAPARRLAFRGDAESLELRLVVAADPSDPGGVALARRVAELLDRPVALSRPFVDAVGRPIAEAEARSTLEAVEALPDAPRVAQADRLPAYRLLLGMRSLPDGRRQANALLEPLLVGGTETRRERLATLRAVLEEPGLAAAAARLGVHRNTLAYRIRRVESLTGWKLADADLRLPLAIAVRLVQSDQD